MRHLEEAKKYKFDEFYTAYNDVQKEIILYKDQLKNKIIYMNCDNPKYSNFWKYFKDNFQTLQLKKIISTYYNKDGLTYKTEYNGIEEIKTQLNGDGDFRSDECVDILKCADLVITNPPFPLWSDYFNILIKYNKKFLILGTILKAGYASVIEKLKNQDVWLGINDVKEFELGEGYYKDFTTKADGKKYKKVACYWYTNIKTNYKRKDLFERQKRKPQTYDDYDNIVNFDYIKDIDLKYEYIGVPVTVFQYDYEKYYTIEHKIKAKINDKYKSQRIILKRKEPVEGSYFYS